MNKFLPGGIYHPWIKNKEITQHAVLDFRNKETDKLRGEGKF